LTLDHLNLIGAALLLITLALLLRGTILRRLP
jgi:hypothetical protein